MLRALKRLHLWWLRYGEGPSLSRTITLVGLVATLAAYYFHKAALEEPAATADRIGLVLVLLFGCVTVLMVLRSLYLLEFWPWRKFHPAAPLRAKYLLDLPPEPGRDSPYRFHLADSIAELKPFVDESEYFLGESNPELDRPARQALYERWLELSPKSFLYLTRTDRACPVALSIILPLSHKGYESLYGTSRERKRVIDFGSEEIARRGPFHYLLIDTFIISQRQERVLPDKARGGRRYGRTLLLRHLALFWKDGGKRAGSRGLLGLPSPHPVAIIAETDKEKLVPDLKAIGFESKAKSAIHCPLFEFNYPLTGADEARANLVNGLIERVWQVRRWKIETNSRLL